MHKSNRLAYANIGQCILDIVFLVLSYVIAYLIASNLKVLHGIMEFIWVPIIYIPIWISIMLIMGMYNKTTFNYNDRIIRNVLFSTLISSMFLTFIMFFIKETLISRTMFVSFVITSVIMSITERLIYIFWVNKYRSSNAKNVVFAGVPDRALEYAYYVKKTSLKINVIGYISIHGSTPFKSKRALGYIDDLENILKANAVDEVIFTLPRGYAGEFGKYVRLCEEMGVTVKMIVDLYDLRIAKTYMSYIGTLPIIVFHSVSLNSFELAFKRLIDIVGALVGLTITGIASLFIVPAIKLSDPGPALFSQDRVGLNGRIFKIYKFRTMYADAEERKKELMKKNEVSGGLMFKMKSDPRITPIGKFLRKTSLDELPQFINVLKGDMSLVGTRPPTVDEVSHYKNYHRRRISFKPGLTGMWQVSGRSNITDFEKVVSLDTQYIDEWSLWLDIKIILKTILVVLKKGDAY
ncbi:sugar transferase [Acetivibrio cellulolyticus]|uniref:sugar transferase n=1 Tax=Acetivibrio cellulolyticus TaxID=35830 RepID=UPI0001E2CBDB|nr:sugar transferase [Acetivibrio cellulolyticus]